MRRALVILGDEELGRALVSGATANTYHDNPKMGVRAATGFRDWKALYYGIYEKFGFVEDYTPPNIVAQKLLLTWTLTWIKFTEIHKALVEWNRR